MNSSTATIWTGLFPNRGYLASFYDVCFIEIPRCNANSIDPDQMQHSVGRDLGLHSLPLSFLWDTRHKI